MNKLLPILLVVVLSGCGSGPDIVLEKCADKQYILSNYFTKAVTLTKDERYVTSEGKTGLKVFGSFDYESDGVSVKKEYINLRFVENNGFQNILSIYDRKNLYTPRIMERINNSIKF